MRHQQQHARRRRDAAQRPGKKTDRHANVDQDSQHRHPGNPGQNMHGSIARAQILSRHVHAQNFRVGRDEKKHARDHRALNYDSRDGLQRIARFRPHRRGALKTYKAEHRQNQPQPQAAPRHGRQMHLRGSS